MKNIKQGVNYKTLIEEIEKKEEFSCWVVGKCIYHDSENSCGYVTTSKDYDNNLENNQINQNDIKDKNNNYSIISMIVVALIAVFGGIFSFIKRKKSN